MQISVIIQARLGSKRLPGKVLKSYKNYTLLNVLVKRLKKSKKIKDIIIATTKRKEDDKIIKFCNDYSLKYFRGSQHNVLQRFYETAKKFNLKNIVRITSDCPFIDPTILDQMIIEYKKKNLDYLSNTYPEPSTYPDGMDIEIFNFNTLRLANKFAKTRTEKEHVTYYMRKENNFKILRSDLDKDMSQYRLTIDYIYDYELFKKIIDKFKNKIFKIRMSTIINFLKLNPKLIKYQKKIVRNEKFKADLKRESN